MHVKYLWMLQRMDKWWKWPLKMGSAAFIWPREKTRLRRGCGRCKDTMGIWEDGEDWQSEEVGGCRSGTFLKLAIGSKLIHLLQGGSEKLFKSSAYPPWKWGEGGRIADCWDYHVERQRSSNRPLKKSKCLSWRKFLTVVAGNANQTGVWCAPTIYWYDAEN